jgi:hypothetical protein
VVAAAVAAASVPLLPGAQSAPVGLANGSFESPDLTGWRGDALSVVRDTPFSGAGALLVGGRSRVPSVAADATTAAPGRQMLTFAVRATSLSVGRTVRATLVDVVGGRSALSAPVTLQPWWQTVAVSLDGASPRVRLAIAGGGTGWRPGDAFVVDEVSIAAVSPTRAQTRGRTLLVNGAPYVMLGAVYFPTAIGQTPWTNPWIADAAQCQADAQLMRVAGVNTLRASLDPLLWATASPQQCMDAFYAAGVRVLWLVQPPGSAQWQVDSPAYLEAYWAVLQRGIALTKDHPATLGYNIGNEINYLSPGGGGWWPQLDELARRAKLLDPLHVTTSTISTNQYVDRTYGGVRPGFVPHIDMWGLNLFARQGTYAPYMQAARTLDPTRPVWFSEYGVDRYRCSQPGAYGETCSTGSGEDVGMQASWDAANWREIAAHLTPVDPAGGIVGGTVFMWADAWWFAMLFSGVGTPAERDTSGLENGFTHDHFPDGHQSSDFYGINLATMPGATGPRVTTGTYDALATLYTGRPGFAVSPPKVTVQGCTATVDFTTSAPVFGRVDFGPVAITEAAGAVVSDSFYPTSFAQATSRAVRHRFALTQLLPSTRYEVHARGFDDSGRTGSPDGARFVTPPAC